MTTTGRKKVGTVAGYILTLTAGRRYLASRPFAERGRTVFPVSITDITDGPNGPEAVSIDLTYEKANAFLAAFNNGETSFEGRVW